MNIYVEHTLFIRRERHMAAEVPWNHTIAHFLCLNFISDHLFSSISQIQRASFGSVDHDRKISDAMNQVVSVFQFVKKNVS